MEYSSKLGKLTKQKFWVKINNFFFFIQAKPKALIYWQSDPKFEQFEENEEVIQTNKTFTTISKVLREYYFVKSLSLNILFS